MNRKIKVCFVMLKAYPLFNPEITSVFGGAEVDVYLLAKELAKDENFDVSCIVSDYGQEQIEIFENVKIIKSLNFDKSPIFYPQKLWQAMKIADADIYFRKMSSLVSFTVALFCKINRRFFVYRTANTGECDGNYIKSHIIRGKAYRWSLKTAKVVFSQNFNSKVALKETTGVDSIHLGNAHYIEDYIPTYKKDILWVGRSSKVKRADLFLKLAKQFPNEHFTMICQKGSYDKNYSKLIEEAKEIHNLKFIKRVEFSKIGEYFRKAKMFVNTSDSEGFPNTFIQACIHSTPILSLNINPDNFIDKENCGYFANGDWNEFSRLLIKLNEPDIFKKLGENGRNYAKKAHDISRLIEIYKKTFIEIVE